MQTFNDSEFSLVGNDGVRMFFDMKGSGSLYFKITDRQAYDLFCREMGIRPDDNVSPDFVMEILFLWGFPLPFHIQDAFTIFFLA